MPDKKKISELQSVVLGNSDYFAVAHDNSGVRQSGKVSTTEVGQKINSGIEYSGIHKEIIDHQNPIAAINDLQRYIVDSILPTDTVSGAVASLPDGAEGIPVKSFKTTITPIQAGSGTPSPSNPRAISARSQFVAIQEDGNNTQIDQKTISLGGTIYGGDADISTGEVNSDILIVDYDGTEDWATNGTNGVWLSVSGLGYLEVAYCNMFEPLVNGTSNSMGNNQIRLNTAGNNLLVKCPDAMTGPDFKTFLESNPLQVGYKVAPTESAITPEVFKTVKGDNNFYTDCGDSTVEYKADVQLYIDKKTANNRSLGLMMNPMSQPEETREEIEQEEIDNDSNER